MATMKIGDKAVKADGYFNVNIYDNGYMMEIFGENEDGNGVSVKILANTLDELVDLVREACEMERRQ